MAGNSTIIRVLIADDHALVRTGTREILARDPEIDVVGEAADGHQTLDLIERLRPDVALVDVVMPGLNGLEVTRRATRSWPEVAILALTVHDEEPYVTAMIEAGAAGYLLKDVLGTELRAAVHAVHRGEAVLDPSVARAVFARVVASREESGGPEVLLTPRELEVLRLVARGLSNKGIAQELALSPRTVQAHLASIFDKVGVASRTGAVIHALRRGWLDLEELT